MHKTRLFPTLLAAAIVASPFVNAAEPEPVYLNDQGTLVIPRLAIGNDIYYAQLDRNGATYNFSLDAATAAKITPQASDDWANESEVIGTWSPAGSEVAVTLDADNTYSWDSPAQGTCPAGVETGTWSLDEETGVLFFRANADEDGNGECGMSHPSRVVRVSRDGDNLVATLSYLQPGGEQVDTDISLAPAAE